MARVIIALFSLLLIAATPTPLPRHHHHAPKSNAAAEQTHGTPSPISTSGYQPGPKPTPAASKNYTYNYYNPPTKPESPPVWFQVGTTVVLIFFTGGLWVTSIWQWRAIKGQATILETIESAYVSINFEPKHFPPPDDVPSIINYWCENVGRTPASFREFAADLCFALSLPATPKYRFSTSYPDEFVVIGPNGGKSRPGNCFYGLNADERQQLLRAGDKPTWFFYGYFRYRGLYGPDDVVGFAFRFNPNMGGFALVEDPKYTYRRKYKRDQPTGLSEPE
jgi:hypothetical protein